MAATPAWASGKLVMVHTNDTHSQIDVADNGLGGVERRKVVVDSIRAEHPDMILIDAGDAVQGTLFFTLYGGEVEMKMMNGLGYDYAILGNHDFDNGVDALAKNLANSDTQWISTNYDVSASPLAPYIKPYSIREVGGKRIAIIGLNLNPEGMIAEGNYDGVLYLDAVKAANATAWHLKHNEKVDLVVAVTHVGYDNVSPSDRDIASSSEDIDVILGGHTHSLIKPGSGDEWVTNAAGRPVLVAQNGKGAQYISEVIIDLDSLGLKLPEYRHIKVDGRLDSRVTAEFDSILAPYRSGVDEMMGNKIGKSVMELFNSGAPLLNFVSDFCLAEARNLVGGDVDIAIMNKGGIRRSLPKGDITQGQIIMMQPFDNRIVVMDIKGADLADALDVMASRGGDGVSRGVEAIFDPATGKCTSVMINGEPLNPDKTYRLATIDYLANGGDYMKPLTHGTHIVKSDRVVYADMIDYIKRIKKVNPDRALRMRPVR